MLYVPSVFGNCFSDDWFDDFDRRLFEKMPPVCGPYAQNGMRTDIREVEDGYEMDIEVPGYRKEDISLTLDQGNLVIEAKKAVDKEEKDEKSGRVVRRERYTGSMRRVFSIGRNLREEDIRAKLEDGVLKLTFPKEEARAVPEKKTITIEG